LEAPDIWPDFHDRFAGQISAELNRALPAPYYARLEMRPQVGIEWTVHSEPIRHAFVEIRDPSRGYKLITLIEIASPSNKRPGADRCAYVQKQREMLDSHAHLIELDLLPGGERLLVDNLTPEYSSLQLSPSYLVLVNRAWKRIGAGSAYQVFPILLNQALPCIPVPLRKELEIPWDLQFVFNHVYDAGPYRRGAVNYSQPFGPPLEGQSAAWAEGLVRAASISASTHTT
jgi:hypothetical protein